MCTVSLKRALSKNHKKIGPPPVKRVHVAFLSLVPCQALVKWFQKIFTMRKEKCFTAGCGLARPTAPNSPNLATHYNLSCLLPFILLFLTQPNSDFPRLRLLRPEKPYLMTGQESQGAVPHSFFPNRGMPRHCGLDKEASANSGSAHPALRNELQGREATHIEHVRQVLGLASRGHDVRIAAGCISAQSLCTIHLADVDLTWRSEQAKLANLS